MEECDKAREPHKHVYYYLKSFYSKEMFPESLLILQCENINRHI